MFFQVFRGKKKKQNKKKIATAQFFLVFLPHSLTSGKRQGIIQGQQNWDLEWKILVGNGY